MDKITLELSVEDAKELANICCQAYLRLDGRMQHAKKQDTREYLRDEMTKTLDLQCLLFKKVRAVTGE